jgi:hypothetical protein
VFSPRPHRIRRSQLLQAQPRCVDRTGTRVDEDIIQERAKSTPKERCDHWDLVVTSAAGSAYERKASHPKVVSARTPHLRAVTHSITHQPRPKVTRDVYGVARLPPKARSKTENKEEEAEWKPFVALRNQSVVAAQLLPVTHTFGTPLLLGSFSAKMTNINKVLAINSEKNWLAFVRNGCGYVQKIAAVAF